MNCLLASIYIKNGIMSVILMRNGMLIDKVVERITDDNVEGSTFKSVLFALSKAMRMVRNYIQNNQDCNDVVFELNNSIVIKWIEDNYAKDEYNDLLHEVISLLQELPIRYKFSYIVKPKAFLYAKDKYVSKKLSISGIDFDSIN